MKTALTEFPNWLSERPSPLGLDQGEELWDDGHASEILPPEEEDQHSSRPEDGEKTAGTGQEQHPPQRPQLSLQEAGHALQVGDLGGVQHLRAAPDWSLIGSVAVINAALLHCQRTVLIWLYQFELVQLVCWLFYIFLILLNIKYKEIAPFSGRVISG